MEVLLEVEKTFILTAVLPETEDEHTKLNSAQNMCL